MIAGELHYFRLPVRSWKPCLRAMRELGFTAVDVPVPWSLHEESRGRLDWTRSLDLGAFIDAAGEAELAVVLRPGPHLGRELPGLGFPRWITDDPAVTAKTAQGAPALWPFPPLMTPLPSYASESFQRDTAAWFAAVADHLGGRLSTGAIVTVVADHELSAFHRRGAFDLDYHDDALAWWHEDGGGLAPPRHFEADHPERAVRWVRFRDRYLQRAAAWLDRAMASAGFGQPRRISAPIDPLAAPLLHAAPSCYGTPPSLPDLKAGLNIACAHTSQALVSISAGGSPFQMLRDPDADCSHLAAAIAGGAHAISVHMAVERDRWYGAWIDADGRATEHGIAMGRVLEAVRSAGWPGPRAQPAVAIVHQRADAHMALASSLVPELPPVLARAVGADALDLGADGAHGQHQRTIRTIEAALRTAQIPYCHVDERAEIDGVRALIVPTLDRIDAELWQRLHEWGRDRTVILGPRRPTRDAFDQPLADARLPKRCGLFGPESADDVAALADDLLSACGELDEDFIVPEEPDVDCTVLRGQGTLLVVANHGSRDREQLELLASGRMWDPYTGEHLDPDRRGSARLSLKRRQVRLFVSED